MATVRQIKDSLDTLLESGATLQVENVLDRYRYDLAPSVIKYYEAQIRKCRKKNKRTSENRKLFAWIDSQDAIAKRKGRCRCGKHAEHADHIIPINAGMTGQQLNNLGNKVGGRLGAVIAKSVSVAEFMRSHWNCQGLCEPCHELKTKREKMSASWASLYADEKRRTRNQKRRVGSKINQQIGEKLGQVAFTAERQQEIAKRKRDAGKASDADYYDAIILATIARDRYNRSLEAGESVSPRPYEIIRPLLEGKEPGRVLAHYLTRG